MVAFASDTESDTGASDPRVVSGEMRTCSVRP